MIIGQPTTSMKAVEFQAQQARVSRSSASTEVPSLGPAVDFTADSSYLVVCSSDGRMNAFETETGQAVANHKLPPPPGTNAGATPVVVSAVACNPKYIQVVTASHRLDSHTSPFADIVFWGPNVED